MIAEKLPQLKEACEAYTAELARLEPLWLTTKSNEEVHDIVRAEEAALAKLQEAFYLATEDINRLDNCQRLTASFILRIAEKYADYKPN